MIIYSRWDSGKIVWKNDAIGCLSGANLSGANLSGADLRGANLSEANLSGADLSRADLSRADLSGADLRGADLRGANLSEANLSGADLSGANLWGANLWGANLSGANLSGANLWGANLSGANLSGANLWGANLSRARGLSVQRMSPLYMLMDQPGSIHAYKLVKADGTGPWAGQNGYQPITYRIGGEYDVPDASTDPQEDCGVGIHLASLDWAIREWQPGYRILVAAFTAQDIACVPLAGNGKFRVRRCKIVGEKNLVELGLVEDANAAQ